VHCIVGRVLPPEAGLRRRALRRPVAYLTFGCLLWSACGRAVGPADDVVAELKMMPLAPVVDEEAHAEITLRDRAGQPVRGATLRVEAHMSHPGMAPVIERALERNDGVYTVRLRLTMAGEWILFVRGTRADSRSIDLRAGATTARRRGGGG
jgi:YtkA-like